MVYIVQFIITHGKILYFLLNDARSGTVDRSAGTYREKFATDVIPSVRDGQNSHRPRPPPPSQSDTDVIFIFPPLPIRSRR